MGRYISSSTNTISSNTNNVNGLDNSRPFSGIFGTGKVELFVTSRTFTVPQEITSVRVRLWGGGGANGITGGTSSFGAYVSVAGHTASGGDVNYNGSSSGASSIFGSRLDLASAAGATMGFTSSMSPINIDLLGTGGREVVVLGDGTPKYIGSNGATEADTNSLGHRVGAFPGGAGDLGLPTRAGGFSMKVINGLTPGQSIAVTIGNGATYTGGSGVEYRGAGGLVIVEY